jgi:hypothetical protein
MQAQVMSFFNTKTSQVSKLDGAHQFGHVKPNLTVYFLVAAQGSHPNLFHSESDDQKLYILLI